MSDAKKDKSEDQGKSLGVLYTGYLEKRNPTSGTYKKRFVVLTQSSLHWFKRDEGYDLFGEERGQIGVGNILTVKVMDEDSTTLEIQGLDHKKRYFRATTTVFCEEWVSAIRSAIRSNMRRPNARRASLSTLRGNVDDDDEAFEKPEVTVSLVSLKSTMPMSEIVVTRNPEWNRLITIASVKPGDVIIISTSNGGNVSLTYDQVRLKAEDGLDFDVAVQDVTLASSLKISITLQAHATDLLDRNSQRQKFKQSLRYQLAELFTIVTSDRASAISTVLSLLVLMAGVNAMTSRSVGPQATLLLLFATALSVYNLFTTVEMAKQGQRSLAKGLPIRLVIHGHMFTSPDAPINDPDSEIPQRFIDGCEGDMKEARRRWEITKHWREAEGVNGILQEPQPFYHLIRTMYPHYHAGRGRAGHVVFYERPGDFQASQLAARGVKTDDLVRHWLFTTEFQWQVLCNNDETAKSIAVIDIDHVKMGDLAGENLNFLKRTIAYANQHYPERSYAIFIVNAPLFFSLLWRIVKPLVHENTQRKVRILSKADTLRGLQEHISLENIPEYYGGLLAPGDGSHDCCRYQSPDVLLLHEHVRRVNNEQQQQQQQQQQQVSGNNSSSYNMNTNNNNNNNNNAVVNRVPFADASTGLGSNQRNDSYEVDLYNHPNTNHHHNNNNNNNNNNTNVPSSRSNNVSTASTEEELPPHIQLLQQQAQAQAPAAARRGSDDWSVTSATTANTTSLSTPQRPTPSRTPSSSTPNFNHNLHNTSNYSNASARLSSPNNLQPPLQPQLQPPRRNFMTSQ